MHSHRLFQTNPGGIGIESLQPGVLNQTEARKMAAHRADCVRTARRNRLVAGQAVGQRLAPGSEKYLDCPAFLAIEVSRFQSLLALRHHDIKILHSSGYDAKTCGLPMVPVEVD